MYCWNLKSFHAVKNLTTDYKIRNMTTNNVSKYRFWSSKQKKLYRTWKVLTARFMKMFLLARTLMKKVWSRAYLCARSCLLEYTECQRRDLLWAFLYIELHSSTPFAKDITISTCLSKSPNLACAHFGHSLKLQCTKCGGEKIKLQRACVDFIGLNKSLRKYYFITLAIF